MRASFVLVVALSACGGRSIGADETGETGETGETDETPHEIQIVEHQNLDLLFVIDDSSTMAVAQARLTEIAPILELFETPHQLSSDQPYAQTNYRIAFTTTDVGNPGCTSSAEAGSFVLQPCFAHLEDFVSGDTDASALACLDRCGSSASELEILPTTATGDPIARVRPWIERIEGEWNFGSNPDPTPIGDAFACFAPQGIAGCQFEAPLEAMRRALDRARTPGDPNFGFLRPDAQLMIVFVTDSVDCSVAPAGEDIFDPMGSKAFWSDPDAESATPAVCWNAGVECMGEPPVFADCDPVNKGSEGQSGVVDADAVLYPVQSYIDVLQAIEDEQQLVDPAREVVVSLVAGTADDGDLHYEESDDPAWQAMYGIGPGCVDGPPPDEPINAGLPPVRLPEFVNAFAADARISICGADYSPSLERYFEQIGPQAPPKCHPVCVLDGDPETAVVEPSCDVVQHGPNEEPRTVIECVRGPDGEYLLEAGSYVIPAGEDLCVSLLGDLGGATPDYADDMSGECIYEGFNLEFILVRRPGVWIDSGTRVTAACTTSAQPEVDCPELGS